MKNIDNEEKEINITLPKNTLWRRLRAYFFAGILITAPLFISLQIAWWILEFIDSSTIHLIPPKYNPQTWTTEYLSLPFAIPGFGLLVLLVGFTLIGALTAGIIGRWFIARSEYVLDKMPFIRTLYHGSKQVLSAVMEDKAESFRHAVLIEYPRPGLWAVAFVTGTSQGELSEKLSEESVSVFLPTTPNPTSGFLLFVPKRDVIELDMSVEDAIKLVISAGIVQVTDKVKKDER